MRLEVTRRSDIALRSLAALGMADHRLSAAELGRQVQATATFIPQAVGPLVVAGWVSSGPGRTGGYRLEVSLDDISIRDVIEAIEGPIETDRCVIARRPSATPDPCALHPAWTTARRHLIDQLAATPVSSLERT